jgi:hypothetical protein
MNMANESLGAVMASEIAETPKGIPPDLEQS